MDRVGARQSEEAVTFGKAHQVFRNRAVAPLGWSEWAAGMEDPPPKAEGRWRGTRKGKPRSLNFLQQLVETH